MTAALSQKKLAIAERVEYDGLDKAARKSFVGISDFIHKTRPEVSKHSAMLRNRLLRAGDEANIFWERVEAGMPLSTAVRLLVECEKEWSEAGARGSMDGIVHRRLARYNCEGTERRSGTKVYRASSASNRATRIARGAEAPRERKDGTQGRHKTAVREAIAAWVASRLPHGDKQAVMLAEGCMREVEVILDSLTSRITQAQPKRADLFAACDRLNIPRPKWGQRADQERAWKNRRSALRSVHPDTLGHDGGRDAFQGIKDAYDIIVAYNDSLNVSLLENGDSDGSEK